MTTSTISELLTGLGQHLGMPGLQLDASHCCQLLFDKQWLVTVVHQGALGRVALHCPIGSAHTLQSLGAAALRAMLQANFMGRGTGRCQLAVSTEGRVCLQVDLALAETDAHIAVQALERLLNQAQTWAEWLERAGGATGQLLAMHPAPAPLLPPVPALPVSADTPQFSNPGAIRQRDWSGLRV